MAYFLITNVLFFFNKKKVFFFAKNNLTRVESLFIFLKKKITFSIKNAAAFNFFKFFYNTKPLFFNFKNIFFLVRKSFFFNKTKYSRIRQICKNIVLLTMLLNVFFILKTNEVYFNFIFNNCFNLNFFLFLLSFVFFLKKKI